MNKIKPILALLISLYLIQIVQSTTAQEDLVTNFPGFGNHNYDIYSGMLNVTSNGLRKLHYVFVESANDPLTDPLVIWLNGGPGCSSLLGLVSENGPFLFRGINRYLTPNPDYTWNKRYNMLYLEGPPGVGFSVNNDPNYKYTEDNSGGDFTQALVQFRKRFQNVINIDNDLYITGESYAGMYIPYFTKHILQHNKKNPGDQIPIKGFLIGNGVFINDNALVTGFMKKQYVQNHFFNRELAQDYEQCEKNEFLNLKCIQFLISYNNVMNNTYPYQIYNYTYSYQQGSESKYEKFRKDIFNQQQFSTLKLQTSNTVQNENTDRVPDPQEIIEQYFNLLEVKQALHVDFFKGDFSMCSDTVFNNYHRGPDSTYLYESFFNAGLRIMIYSGNTDAIIPHQYTTYCIENMRTSPRYQITLTEQGGYRQWYPDNSLQVGGMVQYYKTNTGSEFVYTMVRAAGHEVPEYQPAAGYHLLDKFIQNKPL